MSVYTCKKKIKKKKKENPFPQTILWQRESKYNSFPLSSARSERLDRCNLLLQQRLS